MDTSSQNQNTTDSASESKKIDTHMRLTRVQLVLLLVMCAIGLSVLLFIASNKPDDTAVVETPMVDQTEYVDDAVERTLVGNILEYQEAESYIRFAVADENTYSIHITPSTVITEGEEVINSVIVDPFMETTVVVRPVEENSPYDYEGVSVHIKTLSDLSVEERAARLQVIDAMIVE